jgi:hypothetical protein
MNNIISNIDREIKANNFEEALSLAKQYEEIGDTDLIDLIQKANEGILRIKEQKKRREEERRIKYQELFSKFGEGGIFINAVVMTHIQRVANDPDSIEFINFSEVYYNDWGWVVRCEFRGKNLFGAKVRNTKWFTVNNGTVVDVQDSKPLKLNSY